jgi:transcriptional regulator with XRE-family HTH domain
MSNLKRTAGRAELDEAQSSPRKRARLNNSEHLKLLGVVPSMTIPTCAKTSPEPGIVESIKQILLSGLKSQKQIAQECGLSQTKMSQFMNGAARTKGWGVVETKMLSWLAEFRDQQKHLIDLQAEQAQKIAVVPIIDKARAEVRVKNVYNPRQRSTTSEATSQSAEENCEPANDWSPGHYSTTFDSPNFPWESSTPEASYADLSTFELDLSAEAEYDSLIELAAADAFDWNQFTIGQALGSYFVN